MFLIPGDPPGQIRDFLLRGPGQVPLDPEVPEDRRGGAMVKVVPTPRDMGAPRCDVRSQQFRGQQLGGPPEHPLSVIRVDVVGDPHAFRAFHHLQVDPGTPRGTGLELNLRETTAQFVEQRVEGACLRRDGRTPVGSGTCVIEVAVVVPLDVGDGVFLQDGRHLHQNMFVGSGDRQVEHLLEPAFQGQPVVELHQPFRVRPGHIGVRVDHLGFEPEAELHAELRHPVHQRMQTIRPHLGADHPVAEPGMIVAAGTEPAVVEHVTFHPEGGGALRQVDQACRVVVEIDRLPDVQAHRALRAGMYRQGTQVPVETVGLGVQADGVVEIDPGRGVPLPRRQASLPGQEPSSPRLSTKAASAPVLPWRPSLRCAPIANEQRCGIRSAAQRPPKSMSSRAWPGTGIRRVSSVSSKTSSPALVTVARDLTNPVGSSSTVSSIRNPAETASNTYSTVAGPADTKSPAGLPSTRTSLTRQSGLQALPSREPIRPGVPVQP